MLDGREQPSEALLDVIYPDSDSRALMADPLDPDRWPTGRELTDAEKASTGECVRDAYRQTMRPCGGEVGDEGLALHL